MEKYSNIAKRQVAILYELVFSNSKYLTYDYFKKVFYITEKTIRDDIQTINFYYQTNKIKILYKKGYGYYLSGNPDSISKLKSQLESVYTDLFDVEYTSSTYTRKVIDALYENNGLVTATDIARKLNLSIRTISKLMPDIRENLSLYSCGLLVKPHYGFILTGKELNQRMLYAENFQKYIFDLNEISIFDNDYEKLKSICVKYCQQNDITPIQAGIEKIVSYILVSNRRIRNKIELDELETDKKEIIQNLYLKLNFEDLVREISNIQNIIYSDLEKNIMCMIFVISLDLGKYIENEKYILETILKYKEVLDKLTDIGFLNRNDEPKLKTYIYPLIQDYILIDYLKLPEHFYSSFARKTIKASSFSCAIALQIYSVLFDGSSYSNDYMYTKLCFAIYSYIRSISVTKKLNAVAVYTPYNTLYGESLKSRIMNRWKVIIKEIEVISINELNDNIADKYDCLIYADCINPLKNMKSIKCLKVDYYLTNKDVANFYEKIFVPSHIYHRAFGKVHRDDYYLKYNYTNFDEIKKILYASTSDKKIIDQIDKVEVSEKIMYDGTLNITLYCKNNKKAFSKLFFLEKHGVEKGYRFNRIFVHCIALNHDLYCLRTTEKVMRNILVIDDTTTDIAVEPFRDFYDYYIGLEDSIIKDK